LSIALIRPQKGAGNYAFTASQFPLNILYLASNLERHGVKVSVWDFEVDRFSEHALIKRVEEQKPSIVGISCFTPTILNGAMVAKIIKKRFPNILTVIGGVHFSALPERTLREFPQFDVGVVGEGEDTLLNLYQAFIKEGPSALTEVDGVTGRDGNGQIIVKPRQKPYLSLDEIPFPARELIDFKKYTGMSHRGFFRSKYRITEIMTSRGCPNRCIFCASDVVSGKYVRFRSAQNIIEELEMCIKNYQFNHFAFVDDTFTIRRSRLEPILDALARFGVTWNCNARVNTVDGFLLERMAKSGCLGISFGAESGSQKILDLIEKKITVEQIKRAIRLAKRARIPKVEATFMVGSHPSESYEDVALTEKLIKETNPDHISMSYLVPYPGTKVNSLMKEYNLLPDKENWGDFVIFGSVPRWRTQNFSAQELLSIQKRVLRKFYLSPNFILKRIKEMSTWEEFKIHLWALIHLIFRKTIV